VKKGKISRERNQASVDGKSCSGLSDEIVDGQRFDIVAHDPGMPLAAALGTLENSDRSCRHRPAPGIGVLAG
jgi:hypothetical protein